MLKLPSIECEKNEVMPRGPTQPTRFLIIIKNSEDSTNLAWKEEFGQINFLKYVMFGERISFVTLLLRSQQWTWTTLQEQISI